MSSRVDRLRIRVFAVIAAFGVVATMIGTSASNASASVSSLHGSGVGVAHRASASRMTLTQAPTALKTAVRRALGQPSVSKSPSLQKANLKASDAAPGDRFGYSVAISGNTAVVGAYTKNSFTGAAYVFVRSGTTWSKQRKLTASDGASGDFFGISVAISGDTAVVGASDKNLSTGAAYVFVRSGTTWSKQRKLTASDAAEGDEFGYSVAISGNTAVVGAWSKNLSTGAAYVFVRSGFTWSKQRKLTASDAAPNDYFGYSVAISGNTAVVGAYAKNSYTGAAYVFARSGITWSKQKKLTASDAAPGDSFGYSVAISGNTAVVGAYFKNSSTGAAYVFVRSGITWSKQRKLSASDAASGDSFGYSVAISGSTAVVGAYAKNSYTGAAYVFVLP